MMLPVSGSIEYGGLRYAYTASVYTGKDARAHPDVLVGVEPLDGWGLPGDVEVLELEEMCLADANELLYAERGAYLAQECTACELVAMEQLNAGELDRAWGMVESTD